MKWLSGMAWTRGLLILGIGLGSVACQTSTPPEGEEAEDAETTVGDEEGGEGDVSEAGLSLSYLMTMGWGEAKAMAPQSIEIPPFFRLAGESIEVLRTYEDGTPRRARARGKVFLEVLFREPARVLCQEAYVGDDEVIIRGRSILQRGGSVVEGVDDFTVFYMLGTRLRVIGRHKLSNENEMLAELRRSEGVMARPSYSAGGAFPNLPTNPPPMPSVGPWVGGPNPILPPLGPDAVPIDIRMKMREEADAVEMVPLDPPEDPGQGEPELLEPAPEMLEPGERSAPNDTSDTD